MKQLVLVIQLAIVVAIIFPIIALWDIDKVDKFCQKVKPGITKQRYLALVEQEQVKLLPLVGDEVMGGKWQAIVITRLPFNDYACVTKGVSNIVATTKRVDTLVE
tara:strand:+ start:949 stop:1263 length:315 start_codon:yes stop_codon:yes gene_type:complete